MDILKIILLKNGSSLSEFLLTELVVGRHRSLITICVSSQLPTLTSLHILYFNHDFHKLDNGLLEEVTVEILVLDPQYLVVDDLQDVISGDEVILLPDSLHTLSFHSHFCVCIVLFDLKNIKMIISWLYTVCLIETDPFEDHGKLEG